MNGRIYDPLLGRFLSADLLVSSPGNLQSYNRYSYCGNNPLSTTDPSGFETDADKVAREKREADKAAEEAAARKAAAEEAKDEARKRAVERWINGGGAPVAADNSTTAADTATATAQGTGTTPVAAATTAAPKTGLAPEVPKAPNSGRVDDLHLGGLLAGSPAPSTTNSRQIVWNRDAFLFQTDIGGREKGVWAQQITISGNGTIGGKPAAGTLIAFYELFTPSNPLDTFASPLNIAPSFVGTVTMTGIARYYPYLSEGDFAGFVHNNPDTKGYAGQNASSLTMSKGISPPIAGSPGGATAVMTVTYPAGTGLPSGTSTDTR